MKKLRLLSLTVLTLLLFTGCQSQSTPSNSSENSETHKEQQVTSLTKHDDMHSENTSDSSDSFSHEETNDSGEFYGDTLDSLENAVNEVVQKVNNTTVSGTDSEMHETFLQLSGELQEVENQLDYYDENTENDLEQGKLSYDEASKIEFQIEKLEDLLDTAEDKLEYMFGYDD